MTLHRTVLCFAILIFVIFTGGCVKEQEEAKPSSPGLEQFTLTYIAGEHGSIQGDATQTVARGGSGGEVVAVPAEHYHFTAWSDGVTSARRTDGPVTADLKVTAQFAIDQYTLTYNAAENGTIKGDSLQIVDHGDSGSEVAAVPAAGYHFTGWSDGVTSARRTDGNVTADLEVTAGFAVNQYTLIYLAGPNGAMEGVTPQTVEHGASGTEVVAVPAEHYHFTSWSDGVASARRTDGPVTADLKVTANFAIDQFTLTYTAAENGSIKGDILQTVDHGGSGSEVVAVPAAGYHFTAWSDGVTSARRTDQNITADLKVRAGFAVNQYTLTYLAGPNGTIAGVTPQTVDHGATATGITAVPAEGYHFARWSDGLETDVRIDANVTDDMTVTAVFEINTYTVGGRVSGLMEGTTLVLQNNEKDDLTITANGVFNFAGKMLNGETYRVSVLSQPTSPNQVCTATEAAGEISGTDITGIQIKCVPLTYTIGGSISGLPEDDQIILLNNKTDKIIIRANGNFSFGTPLADGSRYEVSVQSQPGRPNWTCDLKNGAGTLSGSDVSNIIVDCYPKVVLQAAAGIRKVKLNWNTQDFNGVSFNLCFAREDISTAGFSSCRELQGGTLKNKVNSPLSLMDLTSDVPYWFQMEALYESGRQTLSEVVKSTPFGGLNDTGIDWCADKNINYDTDGTRLEKTKSCEALALTYPGQDAVHGRDALARIRKLDKKGGGSAGFDFIKVCNSGDIAGEGKCPPNPLPGPKKTNWGCTHDNVTGLTWEIKTDSGLHGKNNTYSWYNPDNTSNGGEPGLQKGGECTDSDCDTLAYVQAVNDSKLCGSNDWRLPTRQELLSIIDNSTFKPAVDYRYFPNTLPTQYWSASSYSEQENSAWQVYFLYGEAIPNSKNEKNHIRLVRGRTVTFGLGTP